MNGWRGRIGLIVPATNTAMESDFWRLSSNGISIHTARMATKEKVTLDTLEAMEEESKAAAARVSQCKPDVIVFGCTSGSFLKGKAWNKKIEQQLTKITQCPVITTTTSAEKALIELEVSQLDVVTPYIDKTNQLLKNYFTEAGFTLNNLQTFDMINQYEHGAIDPWEIYRLAKETYSSTSDGLFIACTQLRSLDVISMLEKDLGVPVVGAIQATWWYTLKTAGVNQSLEGFGSLLSR